MQWIGYMECQSKYLNLEFSSTLLDLALAGFLGYS
jgi:hypothetical protein